MGRTGRYNDRQKHPLAIKARGLEGGRMDPAGSMIEGEGGKGLGGHTKVKREAK
jgi:hypothetical protein